MNVKTSKIIMKCMGGALAVCSAMAMTGGFIAGSTGSGTKKMMKKTAHKFSDFVDTMANML